MTSHIKTLEELIKYYIREYEKTKECRYLALASKYHEILQELKGEHDE